VPRALPPCPLTCPQRAARYGCKTELTGLLLEWVKDVGSQAGLGPSNTRVSTGSVGTPESRLEVGSLQPLAAGPSRVPLGLRMRSPAPRH
jgi:hypothetical protein